MRRPVQRPLARSAVKPCRGEHPAPFPLGELLVLALSTATSAVSFCSAPGSAKLLDLPGVFLISMRLYISGQSHGPSVSPADAGVAGAG